ncbi:MMPL family transporter [Natronobeatus ordinarius]|uniref:efflux RND transporter permease subunit n=1 Tax=Natronobeatus ordinarius TaxID=2963433 RepID=UPI003CE59B68
MDEAALDADQERQFRASAEEVRTLTSERAQLEATLEQAFEDGTVGVVGPDPRADDLLAALNQVAELQSQYDQLNASYAAGEIDDGAYAENATELETAIETTLQEAADEAALEQDERDDFLAAAADVRSLTSDLFEVETALARVVEGAPFELFQDEFAELEARGEELETRGAELEAEAESIEARGERLADRGDELEVRGDELEAWGEELEARGDDLEAWGDELEARGDELEARGDELEARGDELEAWGEELEAWGEELEARGDDLEAAFEELEEFDPSLDEQLEYLESMSAAAFEEAVTDTLGDDDNEFALGLLPSSYDPGSTSADARMTFITQSTAEATSAGEPGGFGADVVDAQLEMRELASDRNQEYVVFGAGAMMDEIDRSMGDSLAIVGPLALLFVVIALSVAYRDPLDIVLGVLGILAVLVWTFGFMGWMGIAFNQMMIAVPVLLIGLSIDYAIHVFMRHREQREADGVTDDVRGSMTVALAGVGVALVWVTATTAIGFLANLVSPIEPIRAFGIVSAFGILAALVVFGALVPAVKVELDCLLERAGFDRRKRAFGTGESRFASALSVGAIAARRAPLVVLLAVLLLTAGGMYGATQVDTSFEDEDFLADSPPDWVYSLPAPFTPGEYHAKAELDYVNENFQREDAQAQLLIRGEVTDDETLERVAAIEERAGESDVVYVLASGAADVDSPLSTMEDVAANNESFNESFVAADTTGDGVPNENLEALYDELFEVDENAANLIYRTDDGEYEAIRMLVSISGNAGSAETTDEMRDLAASFDDGGTDPRWSAIATGGPIVNHVVEQDLLNTVLESLAITLVVVFVFLTVAYWMTGNSATLGAVTLLPVAFTVSWILGTMYLLGMPFNVLTGMITSLTIGLGVAYSVHVSSRYTLELERQGNVWDAMHTTVTGTGGALLGSAATTVGGFGTLALAILPALQQFGIITGLTIVYAFLASVIVLPTLLVLWTRYFGPDVSFDVSSRTPATPTASDGGQDVSSGGDE